MTAVRGTVSVLPEVRVYPSAEELARGCAEEIIRTAQASIALRGKFTVALAGGSTPRKSYAQLARRAREIDWNRVRIFWSDERCVPREDPQSNFGMARETLLEPGRVPEASIHRWKTELPPPEAALDYERMLSEAFRIPDAEIPVFDLVLLGLGPDGHTASLFPGSAALGETSRRAVENRLPGANTWRLTLTFPVLNAARQAAFLVEGAEKAGVFRRVVREGRADLPAARVRARKTLWILDRAAAGLFPVSSAGFRGNAAGRETG